MIDETTFRQAADAALDTLFKALTRAGETHDLDADMIKVFIAGCRKLQSL